MEDNGRGDRPFFLVVSFAVNEIHARRRINSRWFYGLFHCYVGETEGHINRGG